MPPADASVRNVPSRDPPDPGQSAIPWHLQLLAAGAILAAAGLALWHDRPLNEALFHAVNGLGAAAPVLWSSLSVAGLGLAAWIYLTAFAADRPARAARLLWIIIAGGLVIHFIKHGFASPRPFLALGEGGLTVIGETLRIQSMPSGHSAMAFAMLGLMLAERPAVAPHGGSAARLRLPEPARALGWGLLAIGIALSRLAVGAHWPADALFGAGLGLLFAGLAPHAWPVDAMTRLLSRPLGQRLMALGLAVSALCIGATPAVLAVLGLAHTTLEKRLATGYPLAEPLQWLLALMAAVGARRWWRAAAAPAEPPPSAPRGDVP
jgi:membrane-associated phospholipid phosphatase